MKKNIKIFTLCLATFSMLAIASCSNNGTSSSVVSSSSSSVVSSSSSSVASNSSTHTHTPSSTWASDKNQHWHTCSGCSEKLDAEKHTYQKTIVPASETSVAKNKYTCSVCNYSYEEDRTAFSVTFKTREDHPDTWVKLYDSIKTLNKVELGSEIKAGVIFAVEVDDGTKNNSTITAVKANGVVMQAQTSYMFSATMPSEDVVITVEYEGDATPTTTYSLTYNSDTDHPETTVCFGTSADNIMNGKLITSAKAGDKVYVNVNTDGIDVISAVKVNGTTATKDPTYNDWMLTYFTMPNEDVVITVEYEGDVKPDVQTHSITSSITSDHLSDTFVDATTNIDEILNNGYITNPITTAKTGDKVYIVTSYTGDSGEVSAVKVNGTTASQYDASNMGWMLTYFTMPNEDVVITVEYSI